MSVIGWPADAPCTAGWLTTQYLVRERPIVEVASELDCEADRLASLLRQVGVEHADMHPAERHRPRFDRLIATISGREATRIRVFQRRADEGFGGGRECAEPECDTVLHHLHEGDRCYLHDRAEVCA